MHIARNIMLFAGLAIAAIALAAGSASAQEEPVEVFQETGKSHIEPCNPCNVHIEGETIIRRPDGIPVSICHDEFETDIYHDGTGEIEWTGISEPLPCNVVNCAPPLNHWEIYDMGELATGGEHARVDFCLNNQQCNGHELDITDMGAHVHELFFHEQCPHPSLPFIEIEGHWETEHFDSEDDGIEIEHDR